MMWACLFGMIDLSIKEIAIPMIAGLTGGALSLLAARVFSGQHQHQHKPKKVDDPNHVPDRVPNPIDDPFDVGSSTEKRLALRRKGNRVEVFIEPNNNPEKYYTGWVFDRSVNGLGILVDQPVPKNTTLKVVAVNAPSVTPWVEVEVKNCRETENGWEIGCRFPKQPPWAILLQFG